jgi:hypothetical protein
VFSQSVGAADPDQLASFHVQHCLVLEIGDLFPDLHEVSSHEAVIGKISEKKQPFQVAFLSRGVSYTLERDIVVGIEGRLLVGRFLALALVFRAAPVLPAAPFAFTGEHLHLLSDDFSRVTVLAVPVLPFPGLEAPFYIDGLPFGQILAGNLREPGPEGDVVPLGLLFPFPGLVLVLLAGRQGKLATAVPAAV